jgi:uncharacterized OsmC-like protein
MTHIRQAIDDAVAYLSEHPDEASYTDSVARATLGESLRVMVDGPQGERIETDMPRGVGGRSEHPSPGWLFRAAIASCVASTVGMEAARTGITLTSLQVEVDSVSDDRGILGMDPDTHVGPLSTRVRIIGSAERVDAEELREVLDQGARRCPACDATKRAVEVSIEIETS